MRTRCAEAAGTSAFGGELQAFGARPLHLADDEHGHNFVDGFPVGDAAGRLRVAGTSNELQTGTGRLINLRYTKKFWQRRGGVVHHAAMQIDLTVLPEDSAALQSMIRDAVTATMQRDAQVTELTVENDRLRALIQKLLRHRFGRRSEQLSPDQLKLAIEDVEQEIAEHEAAEDAAAQSEETRRQRRAAHPRRNLGALPAHLPRDEVVIDVDSKQCPCCGGTLHLIGETRTEMLDIVPAQLRAKVILRPRYGCRTCGDAVVQAPAPERPIDGGMATEALLVHVLVSKFCDFLPLYRQSEMLKRQGITIDRSTLSDWVGRTCWWLRPLYDLMVSTVMAAPVVFADDTTLPVLDPGRGKTKTGRLWCSSRLEPTPVWKGPVAILSSSNGAER